MTDVKLAILGGHAAECPHCKLEDKTRKFMREVVERAKMLIISMHCDHCETRWKRVQSPLLTMR